MYRFPFHLERFFHAGERVAVAVSGGADSVALLALLMDARAGLGIVVSVAHYNHRLRGDESDADAGFVTALAAKHGIECFIESAAAVHEKNIEAEARDDRYAFFTRLNVTKVATAHTADDQAETVLGRLLRGSGAAGISGILPQRDKIVRPLLDVRRSDLRAWAAERRLEWREDPSNMDMRFLRNRIRHELMPQLERDYNPGIVEVLCHAAEIARAEEVHWRIETEEAARMLEPVEGGWKLPLVKLVQLSEGLQRRLLRAAIMRAKGNLRRIDFRHVEQIRRLALDGGDTGRGPRKVIELPGCRVEREPDALFFIICALGV